MPLHDWDDRTGWEGVHHLWIAELLRWVKPRLPSEFHAYIGTSPRLAVGMSAERPDVSVRRWEGEPGVPLAAIDATEMRPDVEVAVAAIDPTAALLVERKGRLIAVLELVSPLSRGTDQARYLGDLLDGVNLVLVDVHPRPLGFSFADQIAMELQLAQPPTPTPLAVSYRVGEPAPTGGRFVAIWRRPMRVGESLPEVPLPLDVDVAVTLDLERTYASAASDAYLP